jgi:hypothetical protein
VSSTFDLTGTWEGKGSCKGLLNGEKYKLVVKDSTFLITQNGGAINLQGQDVTGTYDYNGRAMEALAKPGTGQVVGVHCATNPISSLYNEMFHAKATVKPTAANPANAKLKITSIFNNGETVAICKSSYTRIDTDDPGIGPCLQPALE